MAPPSTFRKVLETAFLVCTWLALGLYLEIYGPTLKDLMIITDSNYEDVSVATSGRSIGLFPGCVIGGLLVDKFGNYCHLIIALCLDIAAIVTAIIPWTTDVTSLWTLCFIGGVVESAINIAGQRRILDIWLDKAASPMLLLHMGYGIGSCVVPLYANPFLAVEKPIESSNCTTPATHVSIASTLTGCNNIKDEPVEYIKETRIQYPYTFSAGLVALLSLVFFVYQILTIRKLRKLRGQNQHETSNVQKEVKKAEPMDNKQRNWITSQIQLLNPAQCADGRFWYGLQIFTVILFYFANVGGGERMIANFVRIFSIDQLGFSNDEGSNINSVFWVSFTAGRFIFFLLAKCISIRILVMVETTGLLVTGILLNIFAMDNTTAYWVLVQFLGIFASPCWPSGVAWVDYHIVLTGLGMACILLGGSVGGLAHLRLIGYLYEHVGHHTYLYHVVGYGGVVFLLAIVMNLIGSQHGNRFDASKKRGKDVEIRGDVVKTQPESSNEFQYTTHI